MKRTLTAAALLVLAAPQSRAQALSSAPAAGLTYEDAVREGMQRNLDLLAAKYNIPLAEADELTAGLWNNPSLSFDGVLQPFGRHWNQTNSGGPAQYDLMVAYPLDLSGKRAAAKRSAGMATEAAQAAFQDAARQKLRDIRLAYIDVLTFRRQLDLSREKQANLQQLVDIIENRIGAGGRLPLMRLRAQLARDQAMLDLRQREVAMRSAQTALAVLLGRTDPAAVEPTSPLRGFEMPEPQSLESLVKLALESRPDLQALRLSLQKARLDRGLAVAQRWDNFVVSAGVTQQEAQDANPAQPGSAAVPRGNSWDASLTIPLPLFNRNQGNIRRAQLAAEQIEKQIASLELATRQEIAGIYDQLDLNRGLIIEYETRQLANARKVRDEQQKLVGMGSAALLDYFDAVGAYTSAVAAYYDAVGEYRRNVARLDAACAQEVLP